MWVIIGLENIAAPCAKDTSTPSVSAHVPSVTKQNMQYMITDPTILRFLSEDKVGIYFVI